MVSVHLLLSLSCISCLLIKYPPPKKMTYGWGGKVFQSCCNNLQLYQRRIRVAWYLHNTGLGDPRIFFAPPPPPPKSIKSPMRIEILELCRYKFPYDFFMYNKIKYIITETLGQLAISRFIIDLFFILFIYFFFFLNE